MTEKEFEATQEPTLILRKQRNSLVPILITMVSQVRRWEARGLSPRVYRARVHFHTKFVSRTGWTTYAPKKGKDIWNFHGSELSEMEVPTESLFDAYKKSILDGVFYPEKL